MSTVSYETEAEFSHVASIIAEATLADTIKGIDWDSALDRNEQHIKHNLTIQQQAAVYIVLEEFYDVITDNNITFGNADVIPFDIKLTEGGREVLARHCPRPYAMRGPMLEHM